MSGHLLKVNDEAYEFLKNLKHDLTPESDRGKANREESFSDVILAVRDAQVDHKALVTKEFEVIRNIILQRYKGQESRAELSEYLRVCCVRAMIDNDNYNMVMDGLQEIIRKVK